MRRNHHFYIDGRAGAVGPYPFGQSAGLGVVAPEPVSTSVVPTDPDVRRSPNAIFIADRTRIHFTSYRNVDVGAYAAGLASAFTRAALDIDVGSVEYGAISIARRMYDATGNFVINNQSFGIRTPAVSHIGLTPTSSNGACNFCCGEPFGSGVCPPCARCDSLLTVVAMQDAAGGIMLHEIAHAWGPRFGSSAPTPISHSRGGPHWWTIPNVAALGDSVDIQSVVADSTICLTAITTTPCTFNTHNCNDFSDYDRYLMGLIPSSALSDVQVLHDTTPPGGLGGGTCSSISTVTAASLVTNEGGERVPDSSASPHAFNFALVVISPDAFTPAEIVYYDRFARWAVSGEATASGDPADAFFAATGGLATLSSVRVHRGART